MFTLKLCSTLHLIKAPLTRHTFATVIDRTIVPRWSGLAIRITAATIEVWLAVHLHCHTGVDVVLENAVRVSKETCELYTQRQNISSV